MGLFGGGSEDPKMFVTRYYLSGHWGVCQSVDAIREIKVGEKLIWRGMARNNGTVNVAREGLFGGMKKEGGVKGGIDIMLGRDNQVPPQSLIRRLGVGAENVPGFRGITSLMFYGGTLWGESAYGEPVGGDGGSDYGTVGSIFGLALSFFARLAYPSNACYWGTQPYLKPLWVTAQRVPGTPLDAETAPIPRGSSNAPTSLYVELDDSGSMDELTSNGKTRRENMQVAMHLVLDQLAVQVGQGQRIDLGMSRFNGGKLERPSLTTSGITDFRNFIDAIPPNGGTTPFDAPIQDAVAWFEATRNDSVLVNRINFFITDGEPNPSGSDDTAASLAADLLDRTIPVDMWGINIDLQDTSATAKLHNMESDVPVVSGGNSAELASIFQAALQDIKDANPAHVIYECLTNTDWGLGADPGIMDLDAFRAAGDTLFEEDFGIALAWMQQSSVEELVNDVLTHIKGATFTHPRSGKLTLTLLRDNLDLENLKEITPDNATLTNFSRKGWGETVNEVAVQWTNPATEKEETVRAQDLANIAQQGALVSSSKNYYMVRTVELANRLAERDLREESAPLCSCEVEVNREFWDVVPFEGVKVTWPEYGLSGLVMRVMKVNYGDSTSSMITLELVEDIFSLPLASYIPPITGEWQDPSAPPAPVVQARLMPPPAYMVPRFYGGNLATLEHPSTGVVPMAVNPTTSEGAGYDVLWEETTPSGGTIWAQVLGNVPFATTGELPGELSPEVVTAGLLLGNLFGDGPVAEDLLLIGDDSLADDELELALVTATDPETGEITLRRGVLDTVPKRWAAGTKVAITREVHWRAIPREFLDSQSVTLKFLVETTGGMLEEYEAPEFTGQATVRPTLPTRPANVKVNGLSIWELDTFAASDVITFTWSHRNRLLEDSVMYAWDAASLPLESGVAYRVVIDAYDTDDTLLEAGWRDESAGSADTLAVDATTPPIPDLTAYLLARVIAERNGAANWQTSELRLLLLQAPYDVTVEPRPLTAPYDITVEAVA